MFLSLSLCLSLSLSLSLCAKEITGHLNGSWLDLWGGSWQRPWVDPLTSPSIRVDKKDPLTIKWNVFTLNVWNVFSIFRNTIWFNSAREFPFLVHLYAWPSPQARSLCICKQHEDAFVLQNWVSHGKIHSVEKKANVISLLQQHPYCVFFLHSNPLSSAFCPKTWKCKNAFPAKLSLWTEKEAIKQFYGSILRSKHW